MTFWAYLLRCADDSYYTGHTDNLDHRMAQHHSGATGGYTYKRRPVTLVWSQEFADRPEALTAERQIKGWTRAKKEALIATDWTTLFRLSRSRPLRLPACDSNSEQASIGSGPPGGAR